MTYRGKATTVGNSRALSFEASFFKAHPEFAAGRVEAHVIAPGTMLVTSAGRAAPEGDEEDPVMLAFLAFMEKEMVRRPELIQPLDAQLIADMDELVGDIEVDLDEDLGEDACLP
jgi:antitoxin PrlF